MMDVTKVGELQLISSEPMLGYVPACSKTGGYVIEEYGGELKMREFTFSVVKFMTETLDIPPYFINKPFCVVYGACVDKLVIDSYGGATTELGYIKFTGESLDNLRALLQRIKKMIYVQCSKSAEDFDQELNNFFSKNVLRVTFQGKLNKKGDKYYACNFETLPAEYPEFTSKLRETPIAVPTNIARIRSTAQSSLSASASPSAGLYEDKDSFRFLPGADNGNDDFGF